MIIPALVYISVFAIHFSLLPYAGTGDAFMTQKFQSTLLNNSNYNASVKMGFFEKFEELNHVMLTANSGITTPHPYGIKWYMMPLMERSLYYWTRTEASGDISRIYLLGNPLVWASILVSIIAFTGSIALNLLKRKGKYIKRNWVPIAFLLAYLLNLFTYAFISRVIFLYHYFPSLVLGIVLFSFTIDKRLTKEGSKSATPTKDKRGRAIPAALGKKRTLFFWGFIGATIILFLFFSPLTFGTPMDKVAYELRVWTQSWV